MQKNNTELSSLVLLPLSNNNKELSTKNLTIQSLLEHNNQLIEINKEKSKGTRKTINYAIASSNNLTQHLSIDSMPVNSKVDIMLDLQENSDNYLNINPSPNSKNEAMKYFLEEVLSIIGTHIKSNRKKIYLNKVLRKIRRIKIKIRKNKLQLPVFSTYLNKRIPMILERIQISEDKKKLLREQSLEQKRIKAIQKKEFILHNLKAKYSNIESLKDTNSISYKNLTKLEKK